MARGKRSLTLDERYNKLLEEKKIVEDALVKLNEQQKELESQLRMQRLSKLEEMISKSGKSFEEIEMILNQEQPVCYSFLNGLYGGINMENKTIVEEIIAILQKYDLSFADANNILLAVISKLKTLKIKY